MVPLSYGRLAVHARTAWRAATAAGLVRREVWASDEKDENGNRKVKTGRLSGCPFHGLRKMFKSRMTTRLADVDGVPDPAAAIKVLQGHGVGGTDESYLDHDVLGLIPAVAAVPEFNPPNVVLEVVASEG